jgi:hypothetical protein
MAGVTGIIRPLPAQRRLNSEVMRAEPFDKRRPELVEGLRAHSPVVDSAE